MGAIKVHEFTTLDGVVDTPLWTVGYAFTDELAGAIGALTTSSEAILLGRRTYEMFAPAWSTRTAADDPGAPFFNDTHKYVVSSTVLDLDWGPATLLHGYDPDRIRSLKDHLERDVYVSGSATLVRAMLADGLVDELHLFVYPVAVGSGTRLFREGDPQLPLAFAGSEAYANGVVHLTYGPVSA